MTPEADDELLDRLLDQFNPANELTNEGNYAEALVAVERLLVTCRELADRDIFPLGLARLRDGKLGEGQPLDARLLKLKGKILSETRHANEALVPLEEAAYRAPGPNLVWRPCLASERAGFDAAGALGRSACGLRPCPCARRQRCLRLAQQAYTLLLLGRYDEALVAIDEAIALDPSPPIVGTKGQICRRLERNEDALVWLDRALAQDPNDREHWADNALALYALGCDGEVREAEAQANPA